MQDQQDQQDRTKEVKSKEKAKERGLSMSQLGLLLFIIFILGISFGLRIFNNIQATT